MEKAKGMRKTTAKRSAQHRLERGEFTKSIYNSYGIDDMLVRDEMIYTAEP